MISHALQKKKVSVNKHKMSFNLGEKKRKTLSKLIANLSALKQEKTEAAFDAFK